MTSCDGRVGHLSTMFLFRYILHVVEVSIKLFSAALLKTKNVTAVFIVPLNSQNHKGTDQMSVLFFFLLLFCDISRLISLRSKR